jgi:hypothetical protein
MRQADECCFGRRRLALLPLRPFDEIRIATTKEAIAVRDAILSGKKLPKKARKK